MGKLLCKVCVDRHPLTHVTLVPHQDARQVLVQVVSVTLLDPGGHVLEGRHFCHVVDKYHSMDVSVIMLHHRLPEPLLASGVPQLQLKRTNSKFINKNQKG